MPISIKADREARQGQARTIFTSDPSSRSIGEEPMARSLVSGDRVAWPCRQRCRRPLQVPFRSRVSAGVAVPAIPGRSCRQSGLVGYQTRQFHRVEGLGQTLSDRAADQGGKTFRRIDHQKHPALAGRNPGILIVTKTQPTLSRAGRDSQPRKPFGLLGRCSHLRARSTSSQPAGSRSSSPDRSLRR
jgi:hypothetical protein